MTKKIFSSIMLTAACVLFASMITTVGFLRDYFGGIEESGLREELGIAAVGVEDDGMDYLAALPDGARAFLHVNGFVAFCKESLPLFGIGLFWLIPAVVGLVIGFILRAAGKKATA